MGHVHKFRAELLGTSSFTNGTYYFMVGCGGGNLSDGKTDNPLVLHEEGEYGFIKIHVEPDRLEFYGKRFDGTLMGQWCMEK